MNDPIAVTDLEMVFMLVADGDFYFLFQVDGSTTWALKPSQGLGVYMKFRGLRAGVSWTQVQLARERLARFTSHRAVRVTADLARPWTCSSYTYHCVLYNHDKRWL